MDSKISEMCTVGIGTANKGEIETETAKESKTDSKKESEIGIVRERSLFSCDMATLPNTSPDRPQGVLLQLNAPTIRSLSVKVLGVHAGSLLGQ
jgi:hypothetical protein